MTRSHALSGHAGGHEGGALDVIGAIGVMDVLDVTDAADVMDVTGVQGSTLWLVSIPASTTTEPLLQRAARESGASRSAEFNAPARQRLRRKTAAKDGSSWQIADEISRL
ncbi:hypothetical protein AB0I77_19180 [Streptomyces sp. NPDC050619]|uniref:hypothetical protein n=1 Tax=Streptomyces sp. NPDC050619 TaxID=3157214 RepID=UPI00343AD167